MIRRGTSERALRCGAWNGVRASRLAALACAVLLTACQTRVDRADIRAAVAALGGDDAGAAEEAQRTLAALPERPSVRVELEAAFAELSPAARARLLAVLYERSPARAEPFVRESIWDSDIPLRASALTLVGDRADGQYEAALLQAAREDPEPVRAAGWAGYVRIAEAKVARGEASSALPMFHAALLLAEHRAEQVRCLEGMRAVGRPESFYWLEAFLAAPGLREEVEACALAIAAGMDGATMAEGARVLHSIRTHSEDAGHRERARAELDRLKASQGAPPRAGVP